MKVNLHDLSIASGFLGMILKAQEIKEEIDKYGLH